MTEVGTSLTRRLARMTPDRAWTNLIENVPAWPDGLPKALVRSLGDLNWDDDLRYCEPLGDQRLRRAISDFELDRGVRIRDAVVCVTNGGLDAIGLSLSAARLEGATRVTFAGPVLASIAGTADELGLKQRWISWGEVAGRTQQGGFLTGELGHEDVIYVNTPHNPTGAALVADEIDALAQGVARTGARLIVDAVYDQYGSAQRPASVASGISEWDHVIVVNSFSKAFGVPGIRVGWALTSASSAERISSLLEQRRIAVSTHAQLRALTVLQHGNEALREAVADGRAQIAEWARQTGCHVSLPEGGTQAWVFVGERRAETVADRLMSRHGVVVATGANYRPIDEDHVRLPLGAPTAALSKGLDALDHELRQARAGST